MFITKIPFLLANNSDNPWDYLSPKSLADDIAANVEINGALWSSIYVTLRLIGIVGAVITLAIALTKLATAAPDKRNELKGVIAKKLGIIFLCCTASYIFGSIIGLLCLI